MGRCNKIPMILVGLMLFVAYADAGSEPNGMQTIESTTPGTIAEPTTGALGNGAEQTTIGPPAEATTPGNAAVDEVSLSTTEDRTSATLRNTAETTNTGPTAAEATTSSNPTVEEVSFIDAGRAIEAGKGAATAKGRDLEVLRQSSASEAPAGTPSGQPAETAHDCPLVKAGDHPWLIRITPMSKLPNPPKKRTRKLQEPADNTPDVLPHNRFRRDEVHDPTSPEALEADVMSSMHGSLIKPDSVLTAGTYENDWTITNNPFPNNYLSLIGYNSENNCTQEQWGMNSSFTSQSSQFADDTATFALITTYEPFKVVGEPFLFGAGIDYDLIEMTYQMLEAEAAAQVMIYLFKDKANREDGKTYENATFQFISGEKCKKKENVKKIEGLTMLARTAYFFCGNGIQGWPNEHENATNEEPLIGRDWFQGAPVIYKENNTVVPLGLYVYRIGQTGNPRIYATFSIQLKELFKPIPEYEEVYVEGQLKEEMPDDVYERPPDLKKIREREHGRAGPAGTGRAVTGRAHGHAAELWIMFLGASVSTICFAYRRNLMKTF